MRAAFRSSAFDSFIFRFETRVQAADSYEHQAVQSVVSAMTSAITGSIQRLFFGGAVVSAMIFLLVRLLALPLLPGLVRLVDDCEKESGRPSAHEDAGECLDAAGQPPGWG